MRAVAASAGRAGRLAIRHGRLGLTGRLVRLPVAQITDEFCFSLAAGGWHPLVSALRDYDSRPSSSVESTTFGRFFLDPKPNAVTNFNELLDLVADPPGFASLPPFWLGTYPWGGLDAWHVGRPGPAFGWAHDEALGLDTAELWGRGRTLWYRPANRYTLVNEYRLTVGLYRSIRWRYAPVRARGFPRVTILRRDDGERRGVIVDGHHRLAALAHLGATSVIVEIEATVDAADIDSWYHVSSGHCDPTEARKFFDAFFLYDGSERFSWVSAGWNADVR